MTEKVLTAVRKARIAHAQTSVGQLEHLFKLRNKWTRRKTIASNKLREVQWDIESFAMDLARKACNEPKS